MKDNVDEEPFDETIFEYDSSVDGAHKFCIRETSDLGRKGDYDLKFKANFEGYDEPFVEDEFTARIIDGCDPPNED